MDYAARRSVMERIEKNKHACPHVAYETGDGLVFIILQRLPDSLHASLLYDLHYQGPFLEKYSVHDFQ